jgi:hypothetical protein
MTPAAEGSDRGTAWSVRTRRSLTALFDQLPIRRERNGSAAHPQPVYSHSSELTRANAMSNASSATSAQCTT